MTRLASAVALSLILALAATAAWAQSAPAASAKSQPAPAATSSSDPWWKHAVIYEIYPRSFQDSNNDGIGDLNGITQRLDYLKDLGIDAIWISPMYPSPQVDFGYDISDYRNVDPQYGTLADFDRLVAEAKKRDIRIILDMVANHTSDKHQWFIESASSRTNPKRDWYVWHDAKGTNPDGTPVPPNNWLSVFGHSAWQWEPNTKQFYYHKFYIQQPDLNWRNPKVEQAMFDNMRFWLDRGVVGYRLDAIPTLFEDPKNTDETVHRTDQRLRRQGRRRQTHRKPPRGPRHHAPHALRHRQVPRQPRPHRRDLPAQRSGAQQVVRRRPPR